MQAGDLRKRVMFQQRSVATDSFGAQAVTWTDLFPAWAQIEGLTTREILAAQAITSDVTHRITVRYRATLSNPSAVAALRVLYGSRIFNISGGINVDERNVEIELLATEGLNNG
jgi:SPP1 family predicted phage head-tail adaptor